MSKFTTLAVVGFALAIMGGCGGSDGSQTSATGVTATVQNTVAHKVVPKAEFIKKASAICRAAHERSTDEFAQYVNENTIPSSGPGMVAKAVDVVDKVFGPVYELQIEKISELGAPRGDEEQINAILAAMQEGIERAKQEPLKFIRQAVAFNHASRLAIAYGLPACSYGNV